MSEVVFATLTGLFIAGSVFWFRRTRARMEERLAKVAHRRRGRVAPAPWYLYPRLVVPFQQAQIQISALHGSDGSSARTYAWVGCPEYPDLTLEIARRAAGAGLLERLGWQAIGTGDRAFDTAFHMKTDDAPAARALLGAELRKALLAFAPGKAVRLRVGAAPAYRDGRRALGEHEPRMEVTIRALPPEVDELEGLLAAAVLAHAGLCSPVERRRPA